MQLLWINHKKAHIDIFTIIIFSRKEFSFWDMLENGVFIVEES
jgi:hypothetical protein